MRPQHAFRPRIDEILESRAVPSAAGIATPTGIFGITVSLPPQVPTDSPRVQAAFAAFDQSFLRAVDNVLYAPGPDGRVTPSANRSAFNAAVEQSLETLAQQLIQVLENPLAPGSPTTPTTTNSATESQVVEAIIGTSQSSLESQLLALATSSLSLTTPLSTHTGESSAASLVPNVVTTAELVRPTNRVPVAEGLFPSNSLATPSTSSASSDALQASREIRSAFGGFLSDYFKAVQGVLLVPDASGRIDTLANRAAFDARVSQALLSLESGLASAASRSPVTRGLTPHLQAAIGGDAATSLKSQLATLPTPANPQAAMVREFTLSSTQAIAQALALINSDLSRLLDPANP